MGTIYQLTLRQLAGRWRLTIMFVLSAMPVLIALLMLRSDSAPSVEEFEAGILNAMLAGSIAPLVVLAIAAAAFSNEVEDRTLANLVLSPVPRWQIALPKLLATITIAAPFIAISALLTTYIAFLGDVKAMVAVTVSALAGIALYSSVFVWLGLMSAQAVGLGLLYVVVWEGFFAGFVSGVRLLSIRYHAISLMHGLDPRRFDSVEHVGLVTTMSLIALVFGGFLWMTIRRLRRMDIP